ncbi:hypothetical protein D3C87_2034880 [compost metagenome]
MAQMRKILFLFWATLAGLSVIALHNSLNISSNLYCHMFLTYMISKIKRWKMRAKKIKQLKLNWQHALKEMPTY